MAILSWGEAVETPRGRGRGAKEYAYLVDPRQASPSPLQSRDSNVPFYGPQAGAV